MASTVIRHIHYKPEPRELSIWFTETGRRYKYFDVPPEVYAAFREAPSRGRFYNEQVRGRFACELVEDPQKRRRYYG